MLGVGAGGGGGGGWGSPRSQRPLWLQAVFTCGQFSLAASPRARAETKSLSLIRDLCSLPVGEETSLPHCGDMRSPKWTRKVSVLLEGEKCGRTGSDKSTAAFLYTGVSSLRTDAYVFPRVGEDFFFQHRKDEDSHKTLKKNATKTSKLLPAQWPCKLISVKIGSWLRFCSLGTLWQWNKAVKHRLVPW